MKKRVLGILLVFSMIVCGLSSFAFGNAATGETCNVTVKAAAGGKVSADGTNWSESVVVPVTKGGTLGGSVQYKPDEGYKLDGVTSAVVIKKIAASATNTAAIDDAGNLYTAGDNSRGQLARKLGSYVFKDSVLTKVSTSAKIIDVALGADHIVVLDENGDVWTAGCNGYGALGIDENAGKNYYGTQIETLRKVTVGDGSVKIKAVAAGQYHTILIDENGGVWTAGYNSDGQLGKSENINSGTPNKVFEKAEGLDNVKIVAASGGTSHTVLLDENGNVWTAGNNVYDELGRQTEKNVDSKFEKVTDGISGVKITAIAAGSSYTVLLDENGNVWTVGNNRYGDLGRETNDVSSSVFGKADLQGATAAKFIAAGGTTIVIDTDGNVRTSGINGHGQLGRDTGSESSDWKLLAVTEGIDGAEIIAAATGAGAYHSVLLDKNGVIRTCGANQCDQLCRNGDLKKSGTFAPVTDGMTQTMTFDEMKNTVINSDREFTITSAVREKVQLEYTLNGGEWVDGFTPRDFYYKDEGLLLPDASNIEKPGYTFEEWEISSLTDNPIKCSAKWSPNVYMVTFDANGGTVAQETMQVTYGEELDQMPIPRYKGYLFRGWYDQKWGGRPYSDEKGHSMTTYDKTDDCTLYAYWEEAPTCTITFDPNGGTLTGEATCKEKLNECIREPGEDPVRRGYSFEGWYTDADCTQRWDFDDPISGNMTLYAGWKAFSYRITVKPENGEQDIWIIADCDAAVTEPILTRPGYIFAGWDKEFPAKMPAEDMTITALWTVCDHSGSTEAPTCTDSVVCTVCGGTIEALGHDFSEQESDADQHWDKCSRCDATANVEPHDWDNGVVTISSTCMVAGEKTFTCGKCNATKIESIGASGHNWRQEWQHDATHHWHECLNTYCDVKNNNSMKDGYGEHTGGTATCGEKAECDSCHQLYGEENPENHTGKVVWEQTETKHTKKWDCCDAISAASEAHDWEDGVCKVCEYACKHKGGEATCTEKAVCEICGKAYGDVNSENHTGKVVWEQTETKHTKKWDCCDAISAASEAHDWEDGVCKVCEYACKHKGGEATCTEKAVCEICGEAYGEENPENHTGKEAWKTTETKHTKKWSCCDTISVKEADHSFEDGVCTICAYVCGHKDGNKDHECDLCKKALSDHAGGKATCKDRPVCDLCGEAYGALDGANHANLKHIEAKAATREAEGNIEYWYCDGCGKYYGDAAATGELAGADTVTEKLPNDPAAPKTGDSSNLLLWVALLLISGGVLTGATVLGKKKRFFTK